MILSSNFIDMHRHVFLIDPRNQRKLISDWFYRIRKSKLKNIVTKIVDIQVNLSDIPINTSETTKRIQLFKNAGILEIAVAEQATGKTVAGIHVTVMKKGTNEITEFVTVQITLVK
ncbi:MAG: hypothetical protein KKD69_05420 [Euryarchaeota archaeon]|nr:hypothetical protein [Euryarchaeota archaeon]